MPKAFSLFTANNGPAYVRRARAIAVDLESTIGSETNREQMRESIDRLRAAWHVIVRSRERLPEEVEIAIGLCLLRRTSLQEFDALIEEITACDAPNAAWLRILARDIREQRPQDVSIVAAARVFWIAVAQSLRDDDSQLFFSPGARLGIGTDSGRVTLPPPSERRS